MKGCTAVLLFVLLILGCSGAESENPLTPDSQSDDNLRETEYVSVNRSIIGLYEISIDESRTSAEVIPFRQGSLHLNVLRLLQEFPCNDCVQVLNVRKLENNRVDVRVKLFHPYPDNPDYTGFDVRGIFISKGDFTFPDSHRTVGLSGEVPRLLNPYGYTSLFNPVEYPEDGDVVPALKYIPGHYAPGGDMTATLNTYIPFSEPYELGGYSRLMFDSDWSVEWYSLDLPKGMESFGYAVDASWWPVEDVEDPETDFPPEANSLEAYKIRVLPLEKAIQPYGGSQSEIGVEIKDHQGIDTIDSVTIEVPGLFDGVRELHYTTETCNGAALFTGTLVNENGAGEGSYPLLVRVVDTQEDPNLGQIDGWMLHQVEVGGGWARAWGNCGHVRFANALIDNKGNITVLVQMNEFSADLDPGPGIDMVSPLSACIIRLDEAGEYIWAKPIDVKDPNIACDNFGNIYLTGNFKDTIDADPGPAVHEMTSVDQVDGFLLKLDTECNLINAYQFACIGKSFTHNLAICPDGGIVVAGHFFGEVDLDPGPDIDLHQSNGSSDTFLVKFSQAGTVLWAVSWGGVMTDLPRAIATNGDGNIYLATDNGDILDLDPGPGEYIRQKGNGISIFTPDGTFVKALYWESEYVPCFSGLTVDNFGNLIASGSFNGEVDFDPGPGSSIHNSYTSDLRDCFVASYLPDGNLNWVNAWGGEFRDTCGPVAVDNEGYIYTAGSFASLADFDPGPGVFEMSPVPLCQNSDFISKFNPDGSFVNTASFGQNCTDLDTGLFTDGNYMYVGGEIYATFADLAPGPNLELYEESMIEHNTYLIRMTTDLTF